MHTNTCANVCLGSSVFGLGSAFGAEVRGPCAGRSALRDSGRQTSGYVCFFFAQTMILLLSIPHTKIAVVL